MFEHSAGARRRFHFLAAAGKRHHAAEVAAERTADTRLVDCGTAAEKSRKQIPFDREAMVRHPWERVGSFEGPFRVVVLFAVGVFIGEPPNRVKRTLSAQRLEQLEKSLLALAAHGEVDIGGVQRRFSII